MPGWRVNHRGQLGQTQLPITLGDKELRLAGTAQFGSPPPLEENIFESPDRENAQDPGPITAGQTQTPGRIQKVDPHLGCPRWIRSVFCGSATIFG